MEYIPGLIILLIMISGIISFIFLKLLNNRNISSEEDKIDEKDGKAVNNNKRSSKQASKSSRRLIVKATSSKQSFTHSDLHCAFKGHTDVLTSAAVSHNGKGLITAAEDRTLFSYNIRSAMASESASVVGTRNNIRLDHVIRLCWSPDYTAVVVQKEGERQLEVLKGTKKPDGTLTALAPVREFPEPIQDSLVALRVANNGKFIMTCDVKNQLSLWDLKGNLLTSVDTRHGDTYSVCLSYDDKFIVTTGFTPDAKVFEVQYDKESNFKALNKVFDLSGHSSKIFCSDVALDSLKMVTVSKDGTWRLYNTDVQYKLKESPKFLSEGTVASARDILEPTPGCCLVRISPDTKIILVTVMANLFCYSAKSGNLMRSVEGIYQGNIMDVFFDAGNQYFITVGGKCAYLFHNISGYMETIEDLDNALREATYSGLKERLKRQVAEAREALQLIENRKQGHQDKKKK